MTKLGGYGAMKPYQDNKEDLKTMSGDNNLKATAGTKIGGDKKRGGAMKLFSDFKGVAKDGTKKATKQSRKSV
jgi:hypothetical protein